MKRAIVFVALLFVLALSACSAEPATVEVTRIVTQQPEIWEVTRLVWVEVPVTRIVELTPEIPEVEDTRIVRIEGKTEVEVTRVVERVVTATPEPTVEPTPTVEEQASSPVLSTGSGLLSAMKGVRNDLVAFGGMLDGASTWSAQTIVELYDNITGAPEFNVTGESATLQGAYDSYRSAISLFTVNARDLVQHARDFLASGDDSSSVPYQQWGMARQAVNDAQDILNPAIDSLEG